MGFTAGAEGAAPVLAAVYERKAAGLVTAIEMLLNHEHLVLQDADAVEAALDLFRSGLRWDFRIA